jgi:hypothetical protein
MIVNGILEQIILHWQGLRQGDPLSLMLFLQAMDALGYLFTKEESEGVFHPLSTRTF